MLEQKFMAQREEAEHIMECYEGLHDWLEDLLEERELLMAGNVRLCDRVMELEVEMGPLKAISKAFSEGADEQGVEGGEEKCLSG